MGQFFAVSGEVDGGAVVAYKQIQSFPSCTFSLLAYSIPYFCITVCETGNNLEILTSNIVLLFKICLETHVPFTEPG